MTPAWPHRYDGVAVGDDDRTVRSDADAGDDDRTVGNAVVGDDDIWGMSAVGDDDRTIGNGDISHRECCRSKRDNHRGDGLVASSHTPDS